MHSTEIKHTPSGLLAICDCGDRATEYLGYGEALAWCDEHEHKAKYSRLNAGPRIGLKRLERQFREKSELSVYTPAEREQWRMLADEMAEELARRASGPIEGQMALFSEAPEGERR